MNGDVPICWLSQLMGVNLVTLCTGGGEEALCQCVVSPSQAIEEGKRETERLKGDVPICWLS